MRRKGNEVEWSKEVVLKGHGGRSFVRVSFGSLYFKEAEVCENLKKLEDLVVTFKLFRGQRFEDTQPENSIVSAGLESFQGNHKFKFFEV